MGYHDKTHGTPFRSTAHPKQPKIAINARIPADLYDEMDEWRHAQTATPTLTATVETALELLFETFPAYSTNPLAKKKTTS